MRRLSLTVRLAVLLATFSFVALALLGGALYVALGQQLALRDDGALLTRVEQIRTLLRDMDARELVRDKPQLFANMLGNTESLLVIRPVAGAPLLEVNPGRREVPQVTPLPAAACRHCAGWRARRQPLASAPCRSGCSATMHPPSWMP
ncbi:hypothetical protein [Pseudomonas sp. RW10S2]|uniref:hypothetical protein n=1 Tax=Pseudomonas sp. RW10S2 TaxID=459637 RepID=UPI0032097C6B